MALILASASPRRQALLRQLGLTFTVRAADIDERMDESRGAAAEAARVSRRKAEAIPRQPEDVVVAADTIVCVDGRILGKPRDREDAAKMLRLLSGRTHQVRTGVTVCRGDVFRTATETTSVRFRPLTGAEIETYLATGEPMDKAGAYGIQGLAAMFVEGIEGDYFNVVGLPLCRLAQMLKEFGVAVPGEALTR